LSRQQLSIAIAGAGVGFLESLGIWFAPQEPYQNFIVAAGTLKGALTALLISTSVTDQSSLGKALGVGALYGSLISAVVFLAKGGWMSWDAPFVVPSGAVAGVVLGAIVRRLNPPSNGA
jgi:hypothetical protein